MVAGALWLAACSNTTVTESDSAVSTAIAGDAVGSTERIDGIGSPTTTIADITDVAHPPASGDFVGALVDVTAQTCDREADGWHVTGTATNPTADAVDYRIYVSLLNGASATRALVETEVLAVAAGAAGTFDVLIPIPDDDLRCVLRVERRTPGN